METSLLSETVWSELLLTGHAAIDATHRAFALVIHELQQANPASAAASIAAARAHCEDHFAEEEEPMRRHGHSGADCHAVEHAAVLQSVREVCAMDVQDVATVHRLGIALAEWLEAHTIYLDSALSQWIVRRRYGGAPVAIRKPAALQNAC
ncbi:bacteriohemerythrin [Hydrogenophaga sp. BPS33]|uniref:bacteriohemerythrin n=1 Tax=Hydrogenophaga sp. BPS33 TaxID=2651974 RepID=UPI00131FCF31|nr:hemerythrin domain-containing protein [Hydrogenophaga sp. BPS33]QHE84741.1 hemerythrin [Hydrogenophaga sp. BPS33]